MPHSKGIAKIHKDPFRVLRVIGRAPYYLLHVNHVNVSLANAKHFKEGRTDPSLSVTYFPSRGLIVRSHKSNGKKTMSRLTKKIMIPDSLNTVFHRPLATDKTLLAKRQKQKLLLFSVE
jgi:hypothetical protein